MGLGGHQFGYKLPWEGLQVHEVAVAAAVAALLVELATPSLPKLCDGGILCSQLAARVPTAIQCSKGGGSLLLAGVLDVHVADQVVAQVVAHHHLLHLHTRAHT